MSDTIKPPMHGRDHLKGGQDPIPGLPYANDWIQASKLMDVTNSTGAPSSPTWNVASYESTDIDYQSDDGSIYAANTTGVHNIAIQKAGTYLVRALGHYGEGKANYAMCAATINGPFSNVIWDYNVVRFSPLSYPGNVGGGQTIWEQLLIITDATAPTYVYNEVWQNSGSTISNVNVTLQIIRLT